MHKKIYAFIAACTLSLSAVGCGNSSTPATQATTEATQPTTVATTAPTETTAPQFETITLVDDENCTMTITGINPDGFLGYTLKVFLENKTDKELMFSLDEVSVNGYMCDPFWASTVSAGKKANEEISFLESDFETNGITEVTDITFTLNVYDSNDWTADNFVSQTFTVNP